MNLILTSEKNNKQLLLTWATQCKKENENSFDNDNKNKNNLKTPNNEENKYYKYPKISRHFSIATKKISANSKNINY